MAQGLVIDAHHHYMPKEIGNLLYQEAQGKRRLVNERISITLTEKWFDIDTHLRDMDAGGIDMALLNMSGISVLGLEACRLLNDATARVVKEHPDRFVGCAHTAVHEGEGALEALIRGV